MNEATEDLLLDAIERMQNSIQQRDCPAIVLLDGDPRIAMSDYDYLRDDETAAAFERRAGEKALEVGCSRWALTVPQVWLLRDDGSVAVRAVSNHPLREGEQEAITWVAFDRDAGVDAGRLTYVRRPQGQPVFSEDVEALQVPLQLGSGLPGLTLVRILMDESTGGN